MQPQSYISGFQGKYTVIFDTCVPLTAQVLSYSQAVEFAKGKGIQTDIIWDGDEGAFIDGDPYAKTKGNSDE